MGLFKLIKSYRELGPVEFHRRWKEGANKITPLQQVSTQINFTRITMIGIALGLGVSVWKWKTAWWLAIILFGALGNTYMQYYALNQQKKNIQNMYQLNVQQEVKNV